MRASFRGPLPASLCVLGKCGGGRRSRKEGRKEDSWMEETYLPSGGQEVPPFGEMSRERAGEMRVARVHSVSGLAAIVALSAGINSGMSL